MNLSKNLYLFTVLGVLAFSQASNAEPKVPPAEINHNDCAEHLGYLTTGVYNSGVGIRNARKVVAEAKAFDPANTGYKVDKDTAAWPNQYNPMTDGGADANWVDRKYGPSHDLNDKFFKGGEYKTSKMLSATQIKKNVEAMTQEELDSLPSIRKYDLMMGNFHMPATVEQITDFGLERKPAPEGWEGFCYPMRFIGASCPVPTKAVVRAIPGTTKKVSFGAYDVATISAAHWNGTELYARMGSVNRATRDREPPDAGAYHVMLQTYKIMKQRHNDVPFSAVHDVEPNAQLWNEALQNWESTYTAVKEITRAQRSAWKAPRNAKKWVDVKSKIELTEEAGISNTPARMDTVNGEGLNHIEYEYRLYLDDSDNIMGGAWLSDSGRSFPDLVGFANGRGTGTYELDHDTVFELLKDSTEETTKVIPGS